MMIYRKSITRRNPKFCNSATAELANLPTCSKRFVFDDEEIRFCCKYFRNYYNGLHAIVCRRNNCSGVSDLGPSRNELEEISKEAKNLAGEVRELSEELREIVKPPATVTLEQSAPSSSMVPTL